MSIDKAVVQKSARLARLEFSDAEIDARTHDLNNIFDMIGELTEVETDGIAPLTSVIDMKLFEREDVVTDGDRAEKVLANAPEEKAGFFVVDKVIE